MVNVAFSYLMAARQGSRRSPRLVLRADPSLFRSAPRRFPGHRAWSASRVITFEARIFCSGDRIKRISGVAAVGDLNRWKQMSLRHPRKVHRGGALRTL